MSSENVQMIRLGMEYYIATGDFQAHPDLVWDVANLGWPDQQEYRGADGAKQFLAEWADPWDDWRIEVEDYIDAGERVVAIITQRARSKSAGVPVKMRFAMLWTIRGGWAVRMQLYAHPDEALEAVGLSK